MQRPQRKRRPLYRFTRLISDGRLATAKELCSVMMLHLGSQPGSTSAAMVQTIAIKHRKWGYNGAAHMAAVAARGIHANPVPLSRALCSGIRTYAAAAWPRPVHVEQRFGKRAPDGCAEFVRLPEPTWEYDGARLRGVWRYRRAARAPGANF